MALFTAIKQLVKNRLLILIDENGINVNPKKTPTQNIEWNNVEAFSELKIQSQKMVVIEVNNPEYWIKNENNAIKRKLIEYNFNNYGSPFVISAGSMQINHAELVKIFNENLEKYKN
ncbi:STM3941 family protein [Flavobacterium sp. UGB4466]|uniref:STM3941 family protein n=1 Tax=Flavobacterium sp. UGB4466 TaxID=2730889 RepID=UPI001ED9574F|nr:STM3941 family protein [Flavobacterium sp. UGB4466]